MSYKDLYKLSIHVGSVRDMIECVCFDEEHGLNKDVDPDDILEIMNELAVIRQKIYDAAYDLEWGIT